MQLKNRAWTIRIDYWSNWSDLKFLLWELEVGMLSNCILPGYATLARKSLKILVRLVDCQRSGELSKLECLTRSNFSSCPSFRPAVHLRARLQYLEDFAVQQIFTRNYVTILRMEKSIALENLLRKKFALLRK